MIVKYKVSDFAKDLNLSAKKVLDELNAMGSTGKKNSSTLEENELNYLLEKFSKDNSVKNLDEFLNSAKAAKEEPKPTEKKAEKKAEKKPEAPKAEKKPEKKAPAESVYTVSELAGNARSVFGTMQECVVAALKTDGKAEYTVSEAKEIVSKFLQKEVK